LKKISVIMATYNCCDTVRDSIESIINQTYENWEFVICDDCSEDDTFSILNEYSSRYPGKFIITRNEVNSKLPFSLNRCIEKATGDYIARMDADDISEPERFAEQVKFLEEHPEYSVVGTDMARFDENGIYSYYHSVNNPDRFTLLYEVPFCHATIMMRAEVYRQLGGYTVSPRTVRGQDVDLWYRFFAHGFSGNNIHSALYRVREDESALKRRTFKSSIYASQTRWIGFHLLNYPVWRYYLVIQPIISALLPRKLKLEIRRLRNK